MLDICNLYVSVEGKLIFKGLNFSIKVGEVYVMMGFNGFGKSMLVYVLVGCEGYEVMVGEVMYQGKNLFDWVFEERVREGIFFVFQYLVEIFGVVNVYFFKVVVNVVCYYCGLLEFDVIDFLVFIWVKLKLLEMDEKLFYWLVNEGFFGGEKKCNEIL